MNIDIDLTTQTFENLSPQEAERLQSALETCILDRYLTKDFKTFYDPWATACGFEDSTQQLLFTTIFCQRALLSLLWHHQQHVSH